MNLTLVRVFKLKNADPEETAELLRGVFPDPAATSAGPGLLAPGGSIPENAGGSEGPEGDESPASPSPAPPAAPSFVDRVASFMAARAAAEQAQAEAGSQQVQKNARMTAVADARTSSVVVSTSEAMMSHVEKIIAELDASDARKQNVRIYQLQNSSVAAVERVLRNVFEAVSGNSRATAESAEPDALEQRSESELQEQTAPATSRLNRAARPNRVGTGASFAD